MSEHSVGEIFRGYYAEYRRTHSVSREQHAAARNIMICRTPQLGGRLKICEECGQMVFQYFACKDRHCPQCGHFEKERWLREQKKWVLPIPYYHAVFTISHALNPLVLWNRQRVFDFLLHSVGELLKAYAKRYLGGEIGVTLVLHTWGQAMQFHVHVHCIITGGALVKEQDQMRWQSAKPNFLFPVKELSADFRSQFCHGLRDLWQTGKLVEPDGGLDAVALFDKAELQAWEVYIQRPMCGVDKLLDYLGRYVFRIAISNHRIIAFKDGLVTFSYQDNRDGGVTKIMTIPAVEFIQRFLLHVLPKGLVRIRHFGLHHSSCRSKLLIARSLLGLPADLPMSPALDLSDWLNRLGRSDTDPNRCPACGHAPLTTIWEFGPVSPYQLLLAALFVKLFWRWAYAF
jgi:hypothetical protein